MHRIVFRSRFCVLLVVLFATSVLAGMQAQATSYAAVNHPLDSRPWMNTSLSPDQRADLLLAQMSLDEKIAMLHGSSGSAYVGYVPANARLGIPALKLEDGPAGVADGMNNVTAFPAPVAGAASWDSTVMNNYGQALAQEQWGKGANVALAPTVNILRNPQWGRSFESLGEDPYLTSQLGVADIRGIQSQGVIAEVKHYAANNQEYDRTTVSENVDERTLHEIYLPAFDAAVNQGQVGSVMCSYNKVNNVYACENSYLLQDVLQQQWNFPGFVVSDWGATHSTVAAANAGLDMQMPDDSYFGTALKNAVNNGQVSMATINDHVHRILRTMFMIGLFDHQQTGTPASNVATPQDAQVALQTAEQGTVLLKNDQQTLPLDSSKIKSIAVIGADASTSATIAGGGSAGVVPPYIVTPLQGITKRAGSDITVNYAQGPTTDGSLPTVDTQYLTPSSGSGQGLQSQFFNNMTLSGSPVLTGVDPTVNFNWNGGSPGTGVSTTQWSARWTGTLKAPVTGTYTFSLTSDDGSRFYINNQLLIDNWRDQATNTETATIQLTAGQSYPISVEYYQNGGGSNVSLGWSVPGQSNTWLDQAVQTAKTSDVAVVFANDNESEGSDRTSLELPGSQDQLIQAVAQANPHTVVVLNTGAPVLMPWVDQVSSVVEAWYPGQEDGNAIAAVLFGDVNPSGKLPMTFPKQASDVPANTPAQYPGINGQAQYSEGVFVGYRYYDQNNITPLFPFGYGLSYTTFAYSNLVVSPGTTSYKGNVSVDLDVTNTGSRAGADVAQLYIGIPSTNVKEPPKQLKAFQKVFLQPGQKQHVHFNLDASALSYWDVQSHGWVVQDGTYQVMVGSSSRDIHLQDNFVVKQTNGPRYVTVQAPASIAPGSTGTVTTAFTNGGDIAVHNVQFSPQTPTGWTAKATSANTLATVDAGQTVKMTWSVSAPTNVQPGNAQFSVNVTYMGEDGSGRSQGATTVDVPYSSLAQAFNNVGVSDDSNPSVGNYDGSGFSYSAQSLAQAGLTPGATVSHQGISFTWPNVPSGVADNVTVNGQMVLFSGSGSTLGFLGASTFGTQSGNGTITYTDGTTQQFTLTLADWYANAAAPGGDIVATAANWNQPAGSTFGPHAVSVYYTAINLQAGKTIQTITLPQNSNMHVFALGTK
ncbi:BglX family protein [Ktedonobacteria bacterium brp13]|nr:BglX family protein [Ktedonobacteria bacterium brp13]